MYYLCSENKGADQLRGYREDDLRLCFRICKKPVFSRCGSYIVCMSNCRSVSAEPENYDDFFSLNTVDGSVNKTGLINASDPRKYLLFIQVSIIK